MNNFVYFDEPGICEPVECETLYMTLFYRNSDEHKRMISIGVLEKDAIGDEGTISFQIITFPKDGMCEVGTADLLEDEIDIVIKGLQDAKERMIAYKEKNK